MQKGSSADIQARLRRGPDVIMPETWANRAQRTRHPRELFQAGTKKEVKRLGKWRKDRQRREPGFLLSSSICIW